MTTEITATDQEKERSTLQRYMMIQLRKIACFYHYLMLTAPPDLVSRFNDGEPRELSIIESMPKTMVTFKDEHEVLTNVMPNALWNEMSDADKLTYLEEQLAEDIANAKAFVQIAH